MQAIARRAAAPVFALALFSSAALIFVLQPLFGRMATPLLGGSPAVWNTSMAFFQAALLAGYLYAHLLARVKDLRVQAGIHALVLLAAWLVLPVRVTDALGPPSSEHPALWLVGVLALSVGAPFAAASATAPLLQSWYARTGRADAHDPYYLYAASNLGSFIGLLAYPILIEPWLGVTAQGLAWSAGYVLVFALIATAAAAAIASNGGAPPRAEAHDAAPTWRRRLYWMGAAAVPSALVLGVTLHISTDVASAPMLWVVPLALYLATFVLAFMRGGERLTPVVLFAHPAALALLVVSYFANRDWAMALSGHLVGFFLSALVCHLALARTRPSADRLTEFYFWVSLGGVLGGGFAAFAAPVLFDNVYEYPLALAAAALFRPLRETRMPRLANSLAVAAVFIVPITIILNWIAPPHAIVAAGVVGSAAALVAAGWSDEATPARLRIALLIAASCLAGVMIYVGFNLDYVFYHFIEDGSDKLGIRALWGPAILATSFITLAFAAHAILQPREAPTTIVDIGIGLAIPATVMLIALVLMKQNLTDDNIVKVGLCFCAIALFLNRERPMLLAGLVLISFLVYFIDDRRGGRIITQERSFFGVLRVIEDQVSPRAPVLRVLMHGTTIHGAQLTSPGLTRLPLTYYSANTALGEAILAGIVMREEGESSLALIGLGAGSTACLMNSADSLTIFEIDPEVVRLSTSPEGDFTFVPECQPNAQVRLGDARLRIAEEPDASFNVIVVDAFSSDAIPAHLLTREAIAMYLNKTTEDGIVVLHLSNRNLALVSESARVARDLNAPTLYRVSERFDDPISTYAGLGASVMIVARSPQTLARLPLISRSEWRVIEAPPGRGWSDDYINLPRALLESLNGDENCRIYPEMLRCRSPEERAAAKAAKN